jgi:hypothetical protein
MRKTRKTMIVLADQLGAEIEQPALIVANPLVGQSLALPSDVQLGDTPDGAPAILWRIPPKLDRHGIQLDWGSGGRADQALWAFVDLAEMDDPTRFLAFAQRYGVLGLWPYVMPMGTKEFGIDYWVPSIVDGIRTPKRFPGPMLPDEARRIRHAGLELMRYEPIAEWRRWAAWLRATVDIAYQLRLGNLGTRDQWRVLDLASWYATDRSRQQANLAVFIQQRLLRWSGLTPIFQWTAETPSVALTLGGEEAVQKQRFSFQIDWPPNSLYSALIAQLLAVTVAGTHIAMCSRPGCGKRHSRPRKPRDDQPVYCSDECRKEARKATKRNSARKARQSPSRTDVASAPD